LFPNFFQKKISVSTDVQAKPSSNRGLWLIKAVLVMLLCHNLTFFQQTRQVYSDSWSDTLFILSLGALLGALLFLALNLTAFWKLRQAVVLVFLMTGSFCSHVQDHYGVMIDPDMIRNALETNQAEVMDLFSWALVARLLFTGVLPALWLLKTAPQSKPLPLELRAMLKGSLGAVVVLLFLLFSMNRHYTSFFREHKPLRYYANPITPLTSLVRHVYRLAHHRTPAKSFPVGQDAHINPQDPMRELIIVVVGEAARADHWQLNGYERPTNPFLAQHQVYSLPRVTSCATSTALSIPCMFSLNSREEFDVEEAHATENVLDVLHHSGVRVLWRDNNSDSKGVAYHLPFEDFRTEANNDECDVECRDLGMLKGLDQWIEGIPEGDLLIVLHQMGNHGPAYHLRYPASFEIFTPVCKTNQLEDCTPSMIINAYDNALRYTDYFLSEVINFLSRYDHAPFEVALLYLSDHGESLGENGLYLHGIPFFMAPSEQTHVAALFWFGQGFQIDTEAFAQGMDQHLTHDFMAHTLLGLFEVETKDYRPEYDLCRPFLLPHGSKAAPLNTN
jgi:lipid A ethanolaminephosphotransferase